MELCPAGPHPHQPPCSFFIFIFKFYLWLCWVFVSVRGLSLVVASGGHSSSRCAGLSLSRPPLLRSTGSRRAGSAIVAHGPSRSAACGIIPDQGSNPCALHWQADSQPLRRQGTSPAAFCLAHFQHGPPWGREAGHSLTLRTKSHSIHTARDGQIWLASKRNHMVCQNQSFHLFDKILALLCGRYHLRSLGYYQWKKQRSLPPSRSLAGHLPHTPLRLFTWAQVTSKDVSFPPDEFCFEGRGCSHSCSLTSPHASSRYMSDAGGWILLKYTHLFYSKVGLSTLCLYKWVPQKWSFHRYQVISGFKTSYTLPHLKLWFLPVLQEC